MTASSEAYKIMSHPHFGRVVISTILVNCVFMMLEDPTGKRAVPGETIAGYCFLVIFFFEMVIKMIALSLSGYFEDPWNWLDCVVVSESIFSTTMDAFSAITGKTITLGNVSGLRTLRVLRALKAVNFIPEMKLLFATFFSSMNLVIQITVLLFMFTLIFGDVARVLFAQKLNGRCATYIEDRRTVPSTLQPTIFVNQMCGGKYLCETDPCKQYYTYATEEHIIVNNRLPPGANCTAHKRGGRTVLVGNCTFPKGMTSDLLPFHCLLGNMTCINTGAAPGEGLFSFDEIYSSMAVTFQLFTWDGWQDVVFNIINGAPNYSYMWFYFLIVVVVGSVLILNLYPAVISVKLASSLAEAKEQKYAEMQAEANKADGVQPKERTQFQAVIFGFTQIAEEDRKLVQRVEAARHAKADESEEKALPRLTPTCPGCSSIRAIMDAETGPFCMFIYGCIFANIIVLSMYSSTWPILNIYVQIANKGFACIFIAEAFLRIFVYGPFGYFQVGSNTFDFFVTMLGFLDMVTPPSVNLKVFSVFRIFRLFRLVKLAKAIKMQAALAGASTQGNEAMDTTRLLEVIGESGSWLVYIYLLLFIFLFIFSILGMQFLGPYYVGHGYERVLLDGLTNGSIPTTNYFYGFSTFSASATSMFTVLTTDNWGEIARDAIKDVSPAFMFFFILWMIISKYFICSMVIGVMFNTCQVDAMQVIELSTISIVRAVYGLNFATNHLMVKYYFLRWKKRLPMFSENREGNQGRIVIEQMVLAPNPTLWTRFKDSEYSYLIFDPDGWFRCKMHEIEQTWTFESLIFIATVASSIVVAQEADLQAEINDPTNPMTSISPQTLALFEDINKAATVIFAIEVFVRSVAHGLYYTQNSYLSDKSHVIDMWVTLLSILSIVTTQLPPSFVRVIRLFRCIRPLQLVAKSQAMKRISHALSFSLKPLTIVVMFIVFWLYVFSILGIQLWAGSFQYCEMPGTYPNGTLRPFPPPKTLLAPDNCEVIKTTQFSYDNVFLGMFASFIVFTQDNWHSVLDLVTSSTGVDLEPGSIESSSAQAFFFMCFILISQVLMTLFIATIYGTFMYLEMKEEVGRSPSLMESNWELYRQKLQQMQPMIQPAPPKAWLKKKIYDFFASKKYRAVVTVVVIFNIVVVFLYGHKFKRSQQTPLWVDWMDELFEFYYLLEWILRIYIYELKEMLNPWLLKCWIELIVMLLCAILVTNLPSGITYSASADFFYNSLNSVSSIRVLRIFVIFPEMVELAMTVVRSIPAVINQFLLLALVSFFYAVVGVLSFGGYPDTQTGFLNSYQEQCTRAFSLQDCNDFYQRNLNFNSVQNAMYSLFGMTTAQHYTLTFLGLLNAKKSIGGKLVVAIYMLSFLLIGRFLVVNLFMMTILFEYNVHSPDQTGVAYDQINHFRRCWRDENGAGYSTMHKSKLVDFLRSRLQEPLGVPRSTSTLVVKWYAERVLEGVQAYRLKYDKTKMAKASLVSRLQKKKEKKPTDETNDTTDIAGREDFPREDSETKTEMSAVKSTIAPSTKTSDAPAKDSIPKSRSMATMTPTKAKLSSNPDDYLRFTEILVVLHRLVIVGAPGSDVFFTDPGRQLARQNIGILKLTVLRLKKIPNIDSAAHRDASLTRRTMLDLFYLQFFDSLHRYVLRWIKETDAKGYLERYSKEAVLLDAVLKREQLLIIRQQQLVDKILANEKVGDPKYKRKQETLRSYFQSLGKIGNVFYDQKDDFEEGKWNTGSMETVENAVRHEKRKSCSSISISDDGNLVFIGFEDGQLRICKTTRSFRLKQEKPCFTEQQKLKMPGNRMILSTVSTPDAKKLFIGLNNFEIHCYTTEVRGVKKKKKKGPAVFTFEQALKGHKGPVNVLRICSGLLFSIGGDGAVMLWKFRSVEPVQKCVVCTGPFGMGSLQLFAMITYIHEPLLSDKPPAFLLTGGEDGKVTALGIRTDAAFLATATWKPQASISVLHEGKAKVREVVTSMTVCWNLLYVGGSKGTVEVLQMFVCKPKGEKFHHLTNFISIRRFSVHGNAITGMTFQNGVLFTGSHDLSIIAWKEPNVVKAQPGEGNKHLKELHQALENVYLVTNIEQDWEPGFIGHTESLTCMASTSNKGKTGADMLVTGDASGLVLVRQPTLKETFISQTRLRRLTPELINKKEKMKNDADTLLRNVFTGKKELQLPPEKSFQKMDELVKCTSVSKADTYMAEVISLYYPPVLLDGESEQRAKANRKNQSSVNTPLSESTGPDSTTDQTIEQASLKSKRSFYKSFKGPSTRKKKAAEKYDLDGNSGINDLENNAGILESIPEDGASEIPREKPKLKTKINSFRSVFSRSTNKNVETQKTLTRNPTSLDEGQHPCEQNEKGMITVFVNSWSCVVSYAAAEPVEWIVSEVNRMYIQENSPINITGVQEVEHGQVLKLKSVIGDVLAPGAVLHVIVDSSSHSRALSVDSQNSESEVDHDFIDNHFNLLWENASLSANSDSYSEFSDEPEEKEFSDRLSFSISLSEAGSGSSSSFQSDEEPSSDESLEVPSTVLSSAMS